MAFTNRQGKTSSMKHSFRKKHRKEYDVHWKSFTFAMGSAAGHVKIEMAEEWNLEYVEEQLSNRPLTLVKETLDKWKEEHRPRLDWADLGFIDGYHVIRIYDNDYERYRKPKELTMTHVVFDILRNGPPKPPPPPEPTEWDTGETAREVWSA